MFITGSVCYVITRVVTQSSAVHPVSNCVSNQTVCVGPLNGATALNPTIQAFIVIYEHCRIFLDSTDKMYLHHQKVKQQHPDLLSEIKENL